MYGAALAVIGVTMDGQREAGMINNRVFEVMSSDAYFITEHFTEIEELLEDQACYVKTFGDVCQCVEVARQVSAE